jgi:hypothetical protein
MQEIQQQGLNERSSVVLPGIMIPSFRTSMAIERGVERKILLRTWGGLGDQICAEPTLRFALKTFKNCEVTLASEHPELFEHLKFARVFDLRSELPRQDKYFTFETIVSPDHLTWEFMSHMITNCVDFPSLCAFRCQLPTQDKIVQIPTPKPEKELIRDLLGRDDLIVIHAGRHWQSKTFPKDWWDSVLGHIQASGKTPVLIGANTDDNRGTVDVETKGCVDLRNQLSIMESMAFLQRSKILLTNDSSPLHMAATGNAWIGFIATCKHPDYITHWRSGGWSWRMQNLGLGGIWDVLDYCPNKPAKVEVENVGDDLLRSWLPDPVDFANWGLEKLSET